MMADCNTTTNLLSSVPPAFSNVTFNDIRELYTVESPINVRFTIKLPLQPGPNDNIGLFRIGWLSTRDYIGLTKVPPQESSDADSFTMNVTFNANDLTLEDGEFYQFCYLSELNQVRGVSIPFQFAFDDFEIVCDEQHSLESFVHAEPESVVVTSLDQLTTTPSDSTEVASLNNQIAQLKETVSKYTAEIQNCRQENEQLKVRMQSTEESGGQEKQQLRNEIELLTKQRDDMQKLSYELAGRIRELETELLTERRKITELDTSLSALQDAQHVVAARCTKLSRDKLQLETEVSRLTSELQSRSPRVLTDKQEQTDVSTLQQECQNDDVTSEQKQCLTSANVDENTATADDEADSAAVSRASAPDMGEECQPKYTSASGPNTSAHVPSSETSMTSGCVLPTCGIQQTVVYPYPYPIPQTWFPNPYADYVPQIYRNAAEQSRVYS